MDQISDLVINLRQIPTEELKSNINNSMKFEGLMRRRNQRNLSSRFKNNSTDLFKQLSLLFHEIFCQNFKAPSYFGLTTA